MVKSMQSLQLSILLVLLELVLLPAPSCQEVGLMSWVKNQTANVDKEVGCTKKDAALSSADADMVRNSIDPTTQLNPEDGCYKTISESIANIPDGSTKRYILELKGGTMFREKVFLPKIKPFVTIMSDPHNPALVVWNDTATTSGKDGKPLGVDGSSTVSIESDYFIAYGIVFKNDAPLPKKGENKGEATVLRVQGTKATLYNCTIDGGQGALYDQNGLHYFKACIIRGTIDLIFGFAKSFYEDCNITSVDKATLPTAPLQQRQLDEPIMTAPGEAGLSFKTCTIEGEGQQIYLGRMGTPTIYLYTKFSKKVLPVISDGGNVRTVERAGYYYAQFKCYGSGIAEMVFERLSYAQATPFLGTYYISGDTWIPFLPPAEKWL